MSVKAPGCFICLDNGFVLYHKRTLGNSTEHVARCICKEGECYTYNKGKYRIPLVTEILDHVDLAAHNLRVWIKVNKDKDGFEKAMQELGIKEGEISEP